LEGRAFEATLEGGSSANTRSDGVLVSSYCPDLTAQMKPARNTSATPRLAKIKMRRTDMFQETDCGTERIDGVQIGDYAARVKPNRRKAREVAEVAKRTTVMELKGIRIAQMSGDNKPAAAMLMPTTL
jgi:hypothetical protein